MPGLFELLRDAGGERDKPRLSHAMQIAGLRAAFDAHQAPNTFKPGDLVTPRRESNLKHAGEPHIVLDTLSDAGFTFEGDPTTSAFGQHLNVRTATITPSGTTAVFWMQHADLEPYRSDAASSPAGQPDPQAS